MKFGIEIKTVGSVGNVKSSKKRQKEPINKSGYFQKLHSSNMLFILIICSTPILAGLWGGRNYQDFGLASLLRNRLFRYVN
jgi:hypothetical protein